MGRRTKWGEYYSCPRISRAGTRRGRGKATPRPRRAGHRRNVSPEFPCAPASYSFARHPRACPWGPWVRTQGGATAASRSSSRAATRRSPRPAGRTGRVRRRRVLGLLPDAQLHPPGNDAAHARRRAAGAWKEAGEGGRRSAMSLLGNRYRVPKSTEIQKSQVLIWGKGRRGLPWSRRGRQYPGCEHSSAART